MSNKFQGIEHEIRCRILTGDAYPAAMQFFREGGGGELVRMEREFVNVTAGVSATKGNWIGLAQWIMCPDVATANIVIPVYAETLARFGHSVVSAAVLDQLKEAVAEYGRSDTPITDLWPLDKGAAPLLRR